VLGWICRHATLACSVFSVCTGALLCGAAGLLKGRRATTHWASLHLLPYFGAIPVNKRVVVDDRWVFAAGVTPGLTGRCASRPNCVARTRHSPSSSSAGAAFRQRYTRDRTQRDPARGAAISARHHGATRGDSATGRREARNYRPYGFNVSQSAIGCLVGGSIGLNARIARLMSHSSNSLKSHSSTEIAPTQLVGSLKTGVPGRFANSPSPWTAWDLTAIRETTARLHSTSAQLWSVGTASRNPQ
jgi:hypothetical protein